MMYRPLIIPPLWPDLLELVAARKEAGYVQGEVATAMGVSASLISQLERGAYQITPRVLYRYRRALDTLSEAERRLRERAREALPEGTEHPRLVVDRYARRMKKEAVRTRELAARLREELAADNGEEGDA